MNIENLDKEYVLMALYEAADVQKSGSTCHKKNFKLTKEIASKLLASTENTYFGYLNGKSLKINLSSNEVNTWLYNRDNTITAEETIAHLKDLLLCLSQNKIEKYAGLKFFLPMKEPLVFLSDLSVLLARLRPKEEYEADEEVRAHIPF